MRDLELRKQVAIACGHTDFTIDEYGLRYKNLVFVPKYELSIDAIAAEFDKKGWDWDLERYTSQKRVEYIAVSPLIDYSNSELTGAIALCKLFLELN